MGGRRSGHGIKIINGFACRMGEGIWNNSTQHATATDKGTTTSSQLTRTSGLLACLLNHGTSQDSRES